MKACRLRQSMIALLAFTGAMPAVHADIVHEENIPDINACIEYAEADVIFAAAVVEAKTEYEDFLRLTNEELGELAPRRDVIAKYGFRGDMISARINQTSTYIDIYYKYRSRMGAEGDEPLSNVEVMKTLNQHRKICTETYGHIPRYCPPPPPPPPEAHRDPPLKLCLCPRPIDE